MKVLIITNVFPNSAEETRGIFTYQIVKALQKKCDVEVVAPLPWVPPFLKNRFRLRYSHTNVPAKEKFGNITVHHPRYGVIPKLLSFMHPVFMFVPLLRVIKRLEEVERIDLINAHWIFPDGVAAAWIARKLRTPLVLTGLGCDINHYPSLPFRKKPIRKALIAASRITVKGNGLKQKVLQMGIQEHKVIVIPNGLDLKRFRIMDKKEARRRLDLQEDRQILLFVGSLDQVKGGQYLIEALKRMGENLENPPHLIMVGDGPLQEALLFQTRCWGIANRVSFVGKRPHDEIPIWMNAADIFCLPSIREGRPNVLMEALACGTPAVASNVGSVPEIIQKENGRLARVADPKDICRQLLACLKERWDQKAIRKTVGNFTWDGCAEFYMRTYQQAVGESV
jgi:teichuronic acid biosynthesis glycosyltransferase TuaC